MRGNDRRVRVGLGLAVALLAVGAGHFMRRASRAGQSIVALRTDALPVSPREIPVGSPLPPLALADDAGQPVALSSLRGAPTMLLFFRASTCPICRTQLQALAAVATRFSAAGIQVVASSPDGPAVLADLRLQLGLPIQLLSDADEQAVNALCGGVAHCQILADADGIVRWGAFSESWSHAPPPEALLAAVQAPLASGERR
jgi:peroxiredoxin